MDRPASGRGDGVGLRGSDDASWTRRARALQAAASPLLVCRAGCWRCWLGCPGLR